MNYYMKLIDKYDVISFDIFDTLIKRYVEKPSDIFYLSAKEVFDDIEKCEKFRAERVKAEQKARRLLKKKEIDLDDIYSYIDDTEFKIDVLKAKEIETEIKLCYPNHAMIKIYNYARRIGKKIIIISDMYLPKNVITEMLNQCGIFNYDKLYVSCEYNCNKLTGKLFKYVLLENHFNGKQVIHFGDSIKADIIGAMRGHVRGCLTPLKGRYEKIWNRIVKQ